MDSPTQVLLGMVERYEVPTVHMEALFGISDLLKRYPDLWRWATGEDGKEKSWETKYPPLSLTIATLLCYDMVAGEKRAVPVQTDETALKLAEARGKALKGVVLGIATHYVQGLNVALFNMKTEAQEKVFRDVLQLPWNVAHAAAFQTFLKNGVYWDPPLEVFGVFRGIIKQQGVARVLLRKKDGVEADIMNLREDAFKTYEKKEWQKERVKVDFQGLLQAHEQLGLQVSAYLRGAKEFTYEVAPEIIRIYRKHGFDDGGEALRQLRGNLEKGIISGDSTTLYNGGGLYRDERMKMSRLAEQWEDEGSRDLLWFSYWYEVYLTASSFWGRKGIANLIIAMETLRTKIPKDVERFRGEDLEPLRKLFLLVEGFKDASRIVEELAENYEKKLLEVKAAKERNSQVIRWERNNTQRWARDAVDKWFMKQLPSLYEFDSYAEDILVETTAPEKPYLSGTATWDLETVQMPLERRIIEIYENRFKVSGVHDELGCGEGKINSPPSSPPLREPLWTLFSVKDVYGNKLIDQKVYETEKEAVEAWEKKLTVAARREDDNDQDNLYESLQREINPQQEKAAEDLAEILRDQEVNKINSPETLQHVTEFYNKVRNRGKLS